MARSAVVIGSGAGGLTAAVALARAGWKVDVHEQHYLPGGYTHGFAREGYRFSPGVHYIGELGEGGAARRLFQGLGLGAHLSFLELNPDGYDHVVIGDERFSIPKGLPAYEDRLRRRFGNEEACNALRTMVQMSEEVRSFHRPRGVWEALALPAHLRKTLRHGATSLDRFLDHFTADPMARAILSIQAGDHGMPPSRAPAALHASLVGHYLDGGWYPEGGGKAIPKAFLKVLRAHRGAIHLRSSVASILVEGGRAVGVRLEDGTEQRADAVISNADPRVTWTRLVAPEHVPSRLLGRVRAARYSIASLSLLMATDMDVEAAGMDSGNIWFSRTPDIEACWRYAERTDLGDAPEIPGLFLTATTLKDPGARSDGVHTLEAFVYVNHDAFARWDGHRSGDPAPGYEALKKRLTKRVLEAADQVVPGLSERLLFCELATPLTNEFFVRATRGAMYGTEKSLRNLPPFALGVDTPIDGLYQCGASTVVPGVFGAASSGLLAAAAAEGCPTDALLGSGEPPLRTRPAQESPDV